MLAIIFEIGMQNCIKEADAHVYNTMMARAEEPQPFYPDEFAEWAMAVLDEIGM